MRFLPATARVLPQSVWKSGSTEGDDASGTASLENVKAQPSTAPSEMFTVGPVMAAVHAVALGAAWK